MPSVRWWGRILGAALLVTILAGCASAPVQQMSDARQAIAAAEQAGAARAAPAELAQAKQFLRDAELALRQHNFARANESATKARTAALGALDISRHFGNGQSQSPP
jgi:hypothetical protein